VIFLGGCGRNGDQAATPFESEEMIEDMNSGLSNETSYDQATMEQTEVDVNNVAPIVVAEQSMVPVYDPSEPYVKPTDQEVQQALQNAGLYSGKVDGVMGPRSKKAIRDFQAQNDLNPDGKVGPKTWAKLAPYLHSASVGGGAGMASTGISEGSAE